MDAEEMEAWLWTERSLQKSIAISNERIDALRKRLGDLAEELTQTCLAQRRQENVLDCCRKQLAGAQAKL